MKKVVNPPLYLKPSPVHGYGVFAGVDFKPGDCIEECYALLTAREDETLANYYFYAGDKSAIACGFGSIYNHSDQPNANYRYHEQHQTIVFTARLPIAKDEEILICYGKNWFDSRQAKVKKAPLWYKGLKILRGVPGRMALVLGSLSLLSVVLQVLASR